MVRSKGVIEKGPYVHYQTGAFLQVKNYIITRNADKKCLHLQLVNSFERPVEGVKITLVQLDSVGNVIKSGSFIYDGFSIMPGTVYAINSALILDSSCADFRVRIVYAVSGEYKYFFRNGQAVQTYDPRGYAKKKNSFGAVNSVSARRKYEKRGRAHAGIAWIASLVALLSVAYATIGLFL